MNDTELYTQTKELPIDYLLLKLKMSFNNDLYDNKIISYDIFSKMNKLLENRMNDIILRYRS